MKELLKQRVSSVNSHCRKEVTMPDASVATSAEVEVYAKWALIMVRMTHGSVGADPWSVVQNKVHPAVAEPEFTPLDLSHMSRESDEN
jgi:hypothetical protein